MNIVMDSFRPTKRLPIIIMMNMITRCSTYGTVHFEAICLANATNRCDRDFRIQCRNATINVDTVYYVDIPCGWNGVRYLCIDIKTPSDTENETFSSMFADMCYKTTQCDLSSMKDMSTGRYLLEYSCVKPQTDNDVPPDQTAVMVIIIIGVGIIILLLVGTTVIFIRRKYTKEPDPCDDGQTMPMDSYQNMYVYGQDHVYDQLQAAKDDTSINEGTYNTAIDNAFVIGVNNELEDAQVEGSITDSQVKTHEEENAYEEVK